MQSGYLAFIRIECTKNATQTVETVFCAHLHAATKNGGGADDSVCLRTLHTMAELLLANGTKLVGKTNGKVSTSSDNGGKVLRHSSADKAKIIGKLTVEHLFRA